MSFLRRRSSFESPQSHRQNFAMDEREEDPELCPLNRGHGVRRKRVRVWRRRRSRLASLLAAVSVGELACYWSREEVEVMGTGRCQWCLDRGRGKATLLLGFIS
ncbi:unnamed protein product [Linum trigynum]|uniref:Uncharacterized protein n=1 Tax=Linum trigynum TaxID=586398 RepID=A0AAV2CHK5_9ROSI